MKTFIRAFFSLAVSCSMISCAHLEETTANGKGATSHLAYTTLGGSATLEGSAGLRFTHSHTRSFGKAMDTAALVGGAVAGAVITKSNNTLAAAKDASAAATAQAKIAADAAAAKEAAALAAKSQAFETAVGAGAAPTVGTVVPP